MKVLLTGGAGFIGSHFCERLIANEYEVVVLDNFNDYYDPKLKRKNIEAFKDHPNVTIVDGDLLDEALLDKLFETHRFQMMVHLAARAGVRPSLLQPMLYEKVNVQGTMQLLERARIHKLEKLVIASTSSVYGNNKKIPFSESDPVDHPISPYAATKKACELIASTYHHLYDLNVTMLRFFTVYGPRQRPDMAIHKFTRLIAQGEPIPMYGDGSTRRDYTYIDDIVDGMYKSLQHCSGYNIYNLGESKTISLKELITLIEKNLGKKAIIKQLPLQPGDVELTYADVQKAREEIDYNPQIDIEFGIEKFVEWYQANH